MCDSQAKGPVPLWRAKTPRDQNETDSGGDTIKQTTFVLNDVKQQTSAGVQESFVIGKGGGLSESLR